MKSYRIATVKHHSIGVHYSIPVDPDNLTKAKAQASREFGAGFIGHRIVIFDSLTRTEISHRIIGDNRWIDAR